MIKHLKEIVGWSVLFLFIFVLIFYVLRTNFEKNSIQHTDSVHYVFEAKDCVILVREHTIRVECKL